MSDRLSVARIAVLVSLLGILAWLPGAAADWFGDPRPAEGPRLVYQEAPSDARTSDKPHSQGWPQPSTFTESVPKRVDLRGNEIVRPVARYGVDHRGALYELHSPETEVPQLSPPKL
jgi:hypothetical protein